jgi:competence CoiA-like predicted nuclease
MRCDDCDEEMVRIPGKDKTSIGYYCPSCKNEVYLKR